MSEEWTRWIRHRPGPCPIPVGTECEVMMQSGIDCFKEAGPMTPEAAASPCWWQENSRGVFAKVLHYRIRKPKGLSILEGVLASVTEGERA